jgi:two-component system osmolarity sensor histidine kinase EnvZ
LILPKKRAIWSKVISGWAPQGLYSRTIIIIAAPLVLLQSILAFVFMERHWQEVTQRLSNATVRDIATIIHMIEEWPDRHNLETMVVETGERMHMSAQLRRNEHELPKARIKPFFSILDMALGEKIGQHIGKPFWIDTVGRSKHVEIRILLDDGVLNIITRRSQTYASNSHIFLVWMLGSSFILLVVAIMFLRNQIKPIQQLAKAMESFGRGQPPPADFRPRGATEVRRATSAFMHMRDRIERHVEQRTTMLAGVSHDLRTILTRFKLELALLGDSTEIREMSSDVNEMQAMLEDYLAFAKGTAGEEAKKTNIIKLMRKIRKDTERSGFTLELRLLLVTPLMVVLRRDAFKRAIVNLVNNAKDHADKVRLSMEKSENSLHIIIEDDGPGIPQNELDKVFLPFVRLDEARNQDGGNTGLGLAIARDIIRAHGGEITLSVSEDMGGLKAVASIPLDTGIHSGEGWRNTDHG